MALGLEATVANSLLTTLTATYDFIQLHTGDPGADGTANVAGNATRKGITWGSPSGGSVASSADISWSDAEVDTTEDYTHWSCWDASTLGNFGFSGTVTANAVDATGDSFTILSGSVVAAFGVAS